MEYAHPNVIVDPEWIYDHLNDPQVRIAEVDYNPDSSYRLGHIPGQHLLSGSSNIMVLMMLG
jgi:thiosulfate/3-mercaptopyruvate sulfurtransferase